MHMRDEACSFDLELMVFVFELYPDIMSAYSKMKFLLKLFKRYPQQTDKEREAHRRTCLKQIHQQTYEETSQC